MTTQPVRIMAPSIEMRPKAAKLKVDGSYRQVNLCWTYKEQQRLWGAVEKNYLHMMYHLSGNVAELKMSLDEVIKSTWRKKSIQYQDRWYHGFFVDEIHKLEDEGLVTVGVDTNAEQSSSRAMDDEETAQAAQAIRDANVQRHSDVQVAAQSSQAIQEANVQRNEDVEQALQSAQVIREANVQTHEAIDEAAQTVRNEEDVVNDKIEEKMAGSRRRQRRRRTRRNRNNQRRHEVLETTRADVQITPAPGFPANNRAVVPPIEPTITAHERSCNDLVAIIRNRGEFTTEEWNQISHRLMESLRSSRSSDLIRLMIYLLEKYEVTITLDWNQIIDYKTLFGTFYNELSFMNKRQSYQHNNILQVMRFRDTCKFFDDSNHSNFYFQRFCFELYHTYNLDASQICEILDFFSNEINYDFASIAITQIPQQLEESWFYNTKLEWLKMNLMAEDPQIFEFLARLRWTTDMYDFAWRKFGNSISFEVIQEFTDQRFNLALAPFQSLKLLVETTSFENIINQANLLKQPQECYSLFKMLSSPKKFEVCWSMIANIRKWSTIERVLDIFKEKLKHSSVKGKSSLELDRILIFFCQSVTFGFRFSNTGAKEHLQNLIDHTEIANLEETFTEMVIENIFYREVEEEEDIGVIIGEICSNEEKTMKSLRAKYNIFNETLANHKPVNDEQTEGRDLEEVEDYNYKVLVKVIRAMIKIKSNANVLFKLRKVQLLAILYMIFLKDSDKKGVLCRMFTGEGKTIVVGILAAYFALKDQNVDIVTSSSELSIPQMKELSRFYVELGLEVGAFGNDSPNQDANLEDCIIVYGTVSDFIREKLVRKSFFGSTVHVNRHSDIVIVDEVDNMLIDRSSGLVQLSSIETAALMPCLYPLLIRIYFQVRREYGNYVAPEFLRDCPLEAQEQHIIQALKKSFRNIPDDEHPLQKREYLEVYHLKNLSAIFPNLDASGSQKVVSFFSFDNIVYISKIPFQCSLSVLKKLIANDLNGRPSDFKVYYGESSGDTSEAWIFLKNARSKNTLLRCNSLKIGDDVVTYINPDFVCHSQSSESQMSQYVKSDLEFSKMIAKVLDQECGISEEKGIEMFISKIDHGSPDKESIFQKIRYNDSIIDKEKFIEDYACYLQNKTTLDFTVGYLRYVHLYSYYSGRQFETTCKLLSAELYPITRQPCNTQDLFLNIAKAQYLTRDFQPLQKLGNSQHLRENYRRGIGITYKQEYRHLINTLPINIRQHCLVQFDSWIENCYKAIMHFSKNVGYVRDDQLGKNIKIDSRNTGVLQQNMILADGLQQFLSMKENSILNPISLTSSFQGIVDFFEKYTTLYGLTGTIGDENTQSFLKKTYKVSIVEIPSHFRKRLKQEINGGAYERCYELPGLVYRDASSWLRAIEESVRQQLILNRPVLVFCESVKVLRDSISPNLTDMCHSLGIEVKKIIYDATNKFHEEDRVINGKTLIIATNIAGRGIDFKVSDHMEKTGGMHVCLTYLPSSQRVELQCVGRTGRTGQVGTAQLILMDPNGRTINDLKTNRYEENKKVLQEAESTIAKLKGAREVASLFEKHMTLEMEAVRADNDEQETLNDLRSYFLDICESTDRSVFELKKTNKLKIIEIYERSHPKVSKRVTECFLRLETHVPRLNSAAYTRTVAGLLVQRYSFWMKRHCFNNSRTLEPDILEKFKEFLEEQKYFFKTNREASFDHHVFTAREAFRILLDKEDTNQTMGDLLNLFERTGIFKLVDSSIKPALHFEGLALYYYAGYLCKKLFEEQPKSMTSSLQRIVNVLTKSKRFIDHDIIQSLEKAQNMLVPVNLVYNQLAFITQIFKNLSNKIIVPLIKTINEKIKSKKFSIITCEFIEFDPLLLTFSSDNQYFKEQRVDFSETVVSHAQSFGFFGYFVLQFDPKPENMRTMKAKLRLFGLKFSYITKLFNAIGSIVKFRHLGATTAEVDDSVENEFVSFNIHAQQNFVYSLQNHTDFNVTDAMNRLEVYLAVMGKSQGLFSPLARSILMNKLTENGIFEAVSISGEVDPYIYEGIQVFLNKQQILESWKVKSEKVAAIDENIRVKQIELQSIYTRALNQRFLAPEFQDEFIPLFIMDIAYGHYENENLLKERLTNGDKTDEISELFSYAKTLFTAISINSNSSCDEDAITLYVKMIRKKLQEVVEDISEMVTQKCPKERTGAFEAVALSRYKGFIAFAIKPFLHQVRLEVEAFFSKSRNEADKDMAISNRNITRALATAIGEKLKKSEKKPQETCPMCNERIFLGNRLSNLAEGFGLILVFYSVPNRTQIIYPNNPVGVEKIFLNPNTNQWTMRQRSAPCILELMLQFHGYPNLEKLTNNINQLEVESVDHLLEYDMQTTIRNSAGWHTSEDAEKECYLSLYNDPSSTILEREEKQKLVGYHQINV